MGGIDLSSNIKKEFIIDGLCCANCAAKIEDKVRRLEGVTASSMNFINKILTIEIAEKDDLDSILNKTKDIVKTVEPDAVISEKQVKKSNKKSFVLEGLCCTNCAAKIEDKTKNIPGVKSASLDFISKKLFLEVENKDNMDSIVNEVIK